MLPCAGANDVASDADEVDATLVVVFGVGETNEYEDEVELTWLSIELGPGSERRSEEDVEEEAAKESEVDIAAFGFDTTTFGRS